MCVCMCMPRSIPVQKYRGLNPVAFNSAIRYSRCEIETRQLQSVFKIRQCCDYFCILSSE